MVDWNDPVTLATQYFDFIKLQHALGGVYIWELVTNLQHDWQLIRYAQDGSVGVKWTYLFCRYLAFASIVTIFVGFNVTNEINCKAWLISVFVFSFSAIQLASTLIAIRVIAIWNHNKYFTPIVAIPLLAQIGFFIHQLTRADAAWIPTQQTCLVLHTDTSQANVTVTLIVDFFLLVSMLVGLLRWRSAGRFGLWQFLWNQGIIWLLLATIAEVPTVVFLWLNLNQVMNLMFFTPEMVILVIGATRMYRTLSDFTKSYDPSAKFDGTNAQSAGGTSGEPNSTPMHRVRGRVTGEISSTGGNKFSAVVPLEVGVHQTTTFEERSGDKVPAVYGDDKAAEDAYYGAKGAHAVV